MVCQCCGSHSNRTQHFCVHTCSFPDIHARILSTHHEYSFHTCRIWVHVASPVFLLIWARETTIFSLCGIYVNTWNTYTPQTSKLGRSRGRRTAKLETLFASCLWGVNRRISNGWRVLLCLRTTVSHSVPVLNVSHVDMPFVSCSTLRESTAMGLTRFPLCRSASRYATS